MNTRDGSCVPFWTIRFVIRKEVRPAQLELLDTVVSSLWTDFVVPYVKDELLVRPTEEAMFLTRLQTSALWPSVVDRVQVNRDRQAEAGEMKAKCGRLSAPMFLSRLEKPLWSGLAIGAGLLPPAELDAENAHELA